MISRGRRKRFLARIPRQEWGKKNEGGCFRAPRKASLETRVSLVWGEGMGRGHENRWPKKKANRIGQ